MHGDLLFSTSLPTFLISCLFDNIHFDWCGVISHRSFDLILGWCIWWLVMLNIFSYAYWSCVYLHWKNIYSGLLIFFYSVCFLWYWVMWNLHILTINLLSVIIVANIFSHSVGCLFILSVVCCAVKKLLHLTWLHSYIFAIASFAFQEIPPNIAMIYVKEHSAFAFF